MQVHIPLMAYIRQSGPDSDLGFQVKVLSLCQVVSSSLASGLCFSFLIRNVFVVKGRGKIACMSPENYCGWKTCIEPLSVAGGKRAPTLGWVAACWTALVSCRGPRLPTSRQTNLNFRLGLPPLTRVFCNKRTITARANLGGDAACRTPEL